MKGDLWAYIRHVSLLTVTLTVTVPICAAQPAEKSPGLQIWVTVTSPTVRAYPRWAGIRTDAPDQWKPDAPWQTVASHTQVAKLIAGNIENTRADDLRVVLDEVQRRHMDLALETGPLVRSA